MPFRAVSLTKRLLLALIPGLFISALCAVGFVNNDFLFILEYWPHVFSIYFALFGGFVLAPFITASNHITARGILLAILAPLPYLGVYFFQISTMGGVGLTSWLGTLQFALTYFLTSILLGALLCILAPLKLTPRMLAYLSAGSFVASTLITIFFLLFFCILCSDERQNGILALPFVLWPVLFSLSVYCGRENAAHMNQVT